LKLIRYQRSNPRLYSIDETKTNLPTAAQSYYRELARAGRFFPDGDFAPASRSDQRIARDASG